MGVTCQILINKKAEGIHRAGQAVTGTVKYNVDKQTEYKSITLSLLGTGECSWSESDFDNKSTTYVGTEKYVTIHKNLLQNEQGTGVLNAGIQYEYPFEFHLPEDLPSSFKNHDCSIAYRIQLKFEKPDFFSINEKFSAEIPVYGYVTPTVEGPVIFGLEKKLSSLFTVKKDMINLKAEVAKTFLTPGENAHLALVITNYTDVEPSVKTELYCFTKFTADGGRTNTSNTKVKDCSSDRIAFPERGVTKFTQTIPTSPSLYSITSKIIVKEYRLRVTVRLPMPHANAFVEMPVVIGEKKGVPSVDESVETWEGKGQSSSGMTAEASQGAPPSYWEAMCEDKESDKK